MSKGQAKQLAVLPTLFLGDEKESLPEQLKGWEYVDLRLIDDGERYTTIHRIILCLVVVVVVVLLLPFCHVDLIEPLTPYTDLFRE